MILHVTLDCKLELVYVNVSFKENTNWFALLDQKEKQLGIFLKLVFDYTTGRLLFPCQHPRLIRLLEKTKFMHYINAKLHRRQR